MPAMKRMPGISLWKRLRPRIRVRRFRRKMILRMNKYYERRSRKI
jgi:hypothetical protein